MQFILPLCNISTAHSRWNVDDRRFVRHSADIWPSYDVSAASDDDNLPFACATIRKQHDISDGRTQHSIGVSLRAATAETYRWRRCSTTGVTSESLPEIETVSAMLKTAILDSKDVNLASLLIPHFDLGEYSCYVGSDSSHHLLHLLSSDPGLNRNLTLAEFISPFNKYRNVMCEVWDRRKELDAYEAIVVGIASRIEGTAFYEYHKGLCRSICSPYPAAQC